MKIIIGILMSGTPFEREAAMVLAKTIKMNWGLDAYMFHDMSDLQALSANSDYMIVMTPFTIVRGLKVNLQELTSAPFDDNIRVAALPHVIENGRAVFFRHIDPAAFEKMNIINPKYIRPDLVVFKSSWINEIEPDPSLNFVDDLNTRFGTFFTMADRITNKTDIATHSISPMAELTATRASAFGVPVLCVSPYGFDITKEYPASYDIQIPWECYNYFVKHYSESQEFIDLIASKVDERLTILFQVKRDLAKIRY